MAGANCCPRCRSELSADAPEGLCPECLLQQALAGPGPSPDQEGQGRSPAAAFVPPKPADLARHFPQLEILELLGQGGMGAVYKARQSKLDRLIAVKILPPEVARDPAFAERFMREARSLARLNHPNIVTIYDFGEIEGLYYFSMEFVDGKNVRQLLEAGELPASLALKIVPQVCDALQYAHDEGIVHRDIKPENLLLDKKGRVKIADFGLAKIVGLTPTYLTLTGSQEVMGTLYYMAPEQVRGSHVVDHRADLYSLGVVFYEMLTGELPLGRFAPPSHKAPIDERLDPVVLRALAREPEHRFQDAVGLKREVENIVAGDAAPRTASGQENRRLAPRLNEQWPNVRFNIPRTSWWGGQAHGDIYRDQDTLILEFAESGLFQKAELKELRIPFTEIAAMSCKKRFSQMELTIKATRFRTLAELPVGSLGRGRFLVHREDREAVKQLVKSIVDSHFRPGAQDAFEYKSDVEKAGIEVVAPAAGLLATGILACVSPVVAAVIVTASLGLSVVNFWLLLALPMMVTGLVLVTGAVKMMRLRSYPLAVTAAILALIPWSGAAWLLGLPFGILSLIVLRRRSVMAAFLERSSRGASNSPDAKGPEAGRVVLFFRSMRGYFLPTKFGQNAIRNQDRTVAPEEASPSHPTMDFQAKPLVRKSGGQGAEKS